EAEKIVFKARDITGEFLTLSGSGIEYRNTADPCKLIKDAALQSLRSSLVTCKFNLPEESWEILISPGLLSRIISSVVKNAREAMPHGGVVKIKAENITGKGKKRLPLKDDTYFFIGISDNGCGIPRKNLPRIFDPYFSTKRMGFQKGMGLGLAVVYSIITRLKGHIHVESKEGIGTEVSIYLPSTGKPVVVDEKKQEIQVGAAKSSVGTKRILFMDDEEFLRTTVKLLLEQAGYYVEAAVNGEEALLKYAQAKDSDSPFDAVILDLTIVFGMGGVETIKKLLEIDPKVKGIIFSGYSNDPVMANYETYGFKGALAKPATRAQIVEALKKLC
ncbi:MAG: ATP-binding protein, partial [Pseudomonadota bacterium]